MFVQDSPSELLRHMRSTKSVSLRMDAFNKDQSGKTFTIKKKRITIFTCKCATLLMFIAASYTA